MFWRVTHHAFLGSCTPPHFPRHPSATTPWAARPRRHTAVQLPRRSYTDTQPGMAPYSDRAEYIAELGAGRVCLGTDPEPGVRAESPIQGSRRVQGCRYSAQVHATPGAVPIESEYGEESAAFECRPGCFDHRVADLVVVPFLGAHLHSPKIIALPGRSGCSHHAGRL